MGMLGFEMQAQVLLVVKCEIAERTVRPRHQEVMKCVAALTIPSYVMRKARHLQLLKSHPNLPPSLKIHGDA